MPFVGSEAVDTLIKINERQPTFVGELSDNCAIDLCKSVGLFAISVVVVVVVIVF